MCLNYLERYLLELDWCLATDRQAIPTALRNLHHVPDIAKLFYLPLKYKRIRRKANKSE